MTLKEKIAKRAALVKQMRALLDANPDGLDADQQKKYDDIEKEFSDLDKDIKRIEAQNRREAELRATVDSDEPPATPPGEDPVYRN